MVESWGGLERKGLDNTEHQSGRQICITPLEK